MQKQDIVRDSLIGISSAIPYVGGPVSLLLDKMIPSEIKKREEDFLLEIGKSIQEISLDIANERWGQPEYASYFSKILSIVIEEHITSKKTMCRNMMLNLLDKNYECNEIDFFIHLTNQLSNYSIHTLHCIYTNIATPKATELMHQYPLLYEYIISGNSEIVRYKLTKGNNELTSLGLRYCRFIFTPISIIGIEI